MKEYTELTRPYGMFVSECCDRLFLSAQNSLDANVLEKLNKNILTPDCDFSVNGQGRLQLQKLLSKKKYRTYLACVRVKLTETEFFDVCDGFVGTSVTDVENQLKSLHYLCHDEFGELSSEMKGIVPVTEELFFNRKQVASCDLMYQYLKQPHELRQKTLDSCPSEIALLLGATIEGRSYDKSVMTMNPEDFTM